MFHYPPHVLKDAKRLPYWVDMIPRPHVPLPAVRLPKAKQEHDEEEVKTEQPRYQVPELPRLRK